MPPMPVPEQGGAVEGGRDDAMIEREEALRLLAEQEREVEHEFAEGRALLGTDVDVLSLLAPLSC